MTVLNSGTVFLCAGKKTTSHVCNLTSNIYYYLIIYLSYFLYFILNGRAHGLSAIIYICKPFGNSKAGLFDSCHNFLTAECWAMMNLIRPIINYKHVIKILTSQDNTWCYSIGPSAAVGIITAEL